MDARRRLQPLVRRPIPRQSLQQLAKLVKPDTALDSGEPPEADKIPVHLKSQRWSGQPAEPIGTLSHKHDILLADPIGPLDAMTPRAWEVVR